MGNCTQATPCEAEMSVDEAVYAKTQLKAARNKLLLLNYWTFDCRQKNFTRAYVCVLKCA